jgi:hypothetical protein
MHTQVRACIDAAQFMLCISLCYEYYFFADILMQKRRHAMTDTDSTSLNRIYNVDRSVQCYTELRYES